MTKVIQFLYTVIWIQLYHIIRFYLHNTRFRCKQPELYGEVFFVFNFEKKLGSKHFRPKNKEKNPEYEKILKHRIRKIISVTFGKNLLVPIFLDFLSKLKAKNNFLINSNQDPIAYTPRYNNYLNKLHVLWIL